MYSLFYHNLSKELSTLVLALKRGISAVRVLNPPMSLSCSSVKMPKMAIKMKILEPWKNGRGLLEEN